jgi:hypothetical protein
LEADGDGVADLVGEAEGVAVLEGELLGDGVGVFTTTDGSGQPKGTEGRATGEVGEAEVPGEGVGVAWSTMGVNRGQGGGGGSGEAPMDLITSIRRTTSPPSTTVPTKATAPHSDSRKRRFTPAEPPLCPPGR